jgi:hypothetical protein
VHLLRLVFVCWCLFASAFAQETKRALTNEDVLNLMKGGFTEDVIVAMIEANDTNFDVSLPAINSLKDAGVSSNVMAAMLKAAARNRQGTAATTVSSSPGPAAAPQQLVPTPMMSSGAMGAAGNSAYLQQMMSMAMSRAGMGGMGMTGGSPSMLDTSQLPPLTLITVEKHEPVRPSIAQIASTQTKGDGMPGAGSQATSMLMGLGRQALQFGALSGGMFAGPGGMMAMSMMSGMGGLGGMGRHHGPPKVTYVWALPGRQSSFVVADNKPRFEMTYDNLLGIDPDAYEPELVRLVNSKDNWRLVGATKTTMGQMGTEAYEKVTEARLPVVSHQLARGKMQIEPKQPLEPGEYAVVLRAIHPGKRAEGSLGGGAETSIFFAVWDFSFNNAQR